jgi:hypothetical protein
LISKSHSRVGTAVVSTRLIIKSDLQSARSDSGSAASQGLTSTYQPSFSGVKCTMPHLDTVAGEAASRSATSKTIVMRECNLIISPDGKHNFLLSSRAVLRFSIQTASTGPSRMTH